MSPKQLLFLLLLLLLPVDGVEALRVTFRDHRVSLLDLLLALVLYLDLLEGSVAGLRLPRLAWAVAGLALLAATLSAVNLLWLPGARLSLDVKMTLNLLELAALAWLAPRTLRTPRDARRAIAMIVLGVVVVSAATLAKSLGAEVPGTVRATAQRLGPALLGVTGLAPDLRFTQVVLWAFPVALVPVLGRALLPRAALALLVLAAAAVSLARALWLALLLQAVLVLALRARAGEGRHRRLLAAGALAGVGLALLLWGRTAVDFLYRLRASTVTRRLAGYLHGVELATADPRALLFGAGKGTFVTTFEREVAPHNFFLDVLVSKGVLTALVLAALLVLLLTALARLAARSARAGDRPRRDLAETLLLVLAGTLGLGAFSPITTSLAFLTVLAVAAAVVSLEPGPARGAASAAGAPLPLARGRPARGSA